MGDATTPHPPPPKWPEGPEIYGEADVKFKENTNKELLKGFIWAFLIIIIIHVGLAYVLFF